MTTRDYDDFAAIAADEALLEALGADELGLIDPDLTASDDALADLLAGWRRELDAAVTAPPARGAAAVAPTAVAGWAIDDAPGRPTWLRRHFAPVAAASVLALAGSTGVAAAQSGRSGPLAAVHRVLWGAAAPDDSALVARISTLLDGVTIDLDKARAQGGATAAGISDMSDRLDQAGHLLAGDSAAPDALTARLVELRADLAALDKVPTSPPAVGTDHSGRSARLPAETGSRGPGRGSATDGNAPGGGDGATSGQHRDDAVDRGEGSNGSGGAGGSATDGRAGGSGSNGSGSSGSGGGTDGGNSGSGATTSGSGGAGSGSGGSGSGGSGPSGGSGNSGPGGGGSGG